MNVHYLIISKYQTQTTSWGIQFETYTTKRETGYTPIIINRSKSELCSIISKGEVCRQQEPPTAEISRGEHHLPSATRAPRHACESDSGRAPHGNHRTTAPTRPRFQSVVRGFNGSSCDVCIGGKIPFIIAVARTSA